jgi:hypothetical protein
MKTALLALTFMMVAALAQADELERFWHGFPGFKNTLASYSYDRGFSTTATPAFVDAVVKDIATKGSEQRLDEYLCVLYFMDSKTVTDRLEALKNSPSQATLNAVAIIQKLLKNYAQEPKKI